MWQVAHDCPIGFESVESKKIFFPRIWDGLSVISEFNSAWIELIDGVSGAEVQCDSSPIRLMTEIIATKDLKAAFGGCIGVSIVSMDSLSGVLTKTDPKIKFYGRILGG